MRFLVGLLALWTLPLWSQPAATERLTLAEAEQMALRNHPRILSARYRADASRAQVRQAKAALSPVLVGSITGSAANHGTRLGAGGLQAPDLFSRFGTGVGVSQLLYDFGRTSKLVESASTRADAQSVKVDVVRSELLLQVRQAYFRLLESQRTLELGRQSLENRQLIRRQVQALTDNQLRSTLDLQFAEVAVSEAETLLARLEGDVSTAGAALSYVLGFTDEHVFELQEPQAPEPLPSAADPLVEEALRNRPELISRRKEQEAAHQFAVSEGRLILPSVSATGGVGVIPAGDPRLRSQYAGVGLNVNIPIFNGQAFSGRRQEAEARALSAGQDTREEELRVSREVRTALAEARIAERRIELANRQVEKAARLYTLARARYQAGLGTIVEVNQAELARFSAELGVANARFGSLAASAALDFSIGRMH